MAELQATPSQPKLSWLGGGFQTAPVVWHDGLQLLLFHSALFWAQKFQDLQYHLDDAVCFEFGVHADQLGDCSNNDPKSSVMEDVHGYRANLCKSTTGMGLVQRQHVFWATVWVASTSRGLHRRGTWLCK
jgi:hypothetical protein